jgi:polyprenyl-phospho-N-acetylgalactosaminyl synthase
MREKTGVQDGNTHHAMSVWVVVAAYNEERVIASTVGSLRDTFSQIVVVDDGSTDTTAMGALDAGAHVCSHPINLGQGAALQTGIDFALRRGAQLIITFDADAQHDVHDAEGMVNYISSMGVDVVLGSRFLGDSVGMSRRKRLLLKVATLFTRLTTQMKVTDTHNGLRCFTRSAAQRIKIRQNRMAHASEILAQISSLKMTYAEYPCTITYTDYSKARGQRMSGAITILADLFFGKLHR